MIRRLVVLLALGCASLLAAVPVVAATPTPPAPAECLSPNMICRYVGGVWLPDFRSPPPVDHGFSWGFPYPIFLLFGAFALFLVALNLGTRLRRKWRSRGAYAG